MLSFASSGSLAVLAGSSAFVGAVALSLTFHSVASSSIANAARHHGACPDLCTDAFARFVATGSLYTTPAMAGGDNNNGRWK